MRPRLAALAAGLARVRPRLAVLIALLAVVVVFAAQVWTRRPAGPGGMRAAAALEVEPDRRLDFANATTRAELEELLESAYRLPPDRRMTSALEHVTRLLAPAAEGAEVRLDWFADRWEVTVGGRPAGTLAALPSFADGLAAAERWARGCWAAGPLPAGEPEGIATAFLGDAMPELALAHLDATVERTGLTAALLEQAMVAFTQLSLLLREDRTSFADSTMARALAFLAITRAAGRGAHSREQCALAWAMGYTEEAAALAASLPSGDPVRDLVLHRDAPLALAARRPDASRETRLCDLLARARAGDLDGWLAAVRATGDPSGRETLNALATALAFRRFDVSRVVGPALLRASLWNVPDAPDPPRADSATMEAFERMLGRPEVARRGALAGGAIAAARRALFYSGLIALHDHVLHRLSSPRAASEWSASLPADPAQPEAWFPRWQRNLAREASGEDVARALWADLEDPLVPPPCAFQSFEALVGRMLPSTTAARAATRALAARLDSRPRWAEEFALVAQSQVRWPTLTERLLAHAVRSAGNELTRATLTLAMMRDDRGRLAELVADPATDPGLAVRALRVWLEADSGAVAALLPRFARLAAREPADWRIASAHAEVLEARGRLAEAERAVRRWMDEADRSQDALDSTFAVTTLARLQRKQGRLAEALHTMGHLEQGQQRGAMEEKARLLAMTGAPDQALALARQVQERYPQVVEARALPVELLWRAGRDGQAAALLAEFPSTSLELMAEVASGFASVFGGRHDDAERALAAVRAAAPAYPRLLWWIVREFRDAGDHAFAAALAERAHPGSGADRGIGVATTFQTIAAARGEASARAWLVRQSMDIPSRVLACGFLTTRGHQASAWEQALELPDEDYVRLMRAATWRMDGRRRGSWADTLRAHWGGPGGGIYSELTGFLLGEVGEAQVLALADSPKHRIEVWYHCALAAWSEGRARDAVFWMVLCQETGSVRDGEYAWSHAVLADWSGAWRVPERLGIAPRSRA